MPNPRLPPEILLHVISFLNWTDKQTLVSLTKTSCTVRTFTLPKLYHSPYPANWLLLRTLHENPELGQHVDSLTLHCDEIKNEDERGRFFSGEDIDGDIPGYDEDIDEDEDRSTLMEARDPTIMDILDTFGIDPKSLIGQESINASEYGAWCLLVSLSFQLHATRAIPT